MYLNRSRKVPELWAAVEARLPDGCRSTSAVASLSCTFGSHLRTAAPSLLTSPRRLPLASSCVSSAVSNHALQERARACIYSLAFAAAFIPLWILPTSFSALAAGAFCIQFGVQGAWGVVRINVYPVRFFVTERFLTSPFSLSPPTPPPSFLHADSHPARGNLSAGVPRHLPWGCIPAR